jgi:bifunctional non-homologous end joining protein LigD
MKAGKTVGLVFFAFDLLFLGDQDLRALPLMERKKRLLALLAENKDQKMIQLAEHLDVAGSEVLQAACNLRLEGIVSKRLSEPYVSGRTGIWTKAKCRATQHAIVGGWTVSPKGFSGLLLGVYKGRKLIPIGRVGTGYTEDAAMAGAAVETDRDRCLPVLCAGPAQARPHNPLGQARAGSRIRDDQLDQ